MCPQDGHRQYAPDRLGRLHSTGLVRHAGHAMSIVRGYPKVVTCSNTLTVRSTATYLEELAGGLSGPRDPVRVPSDTERGVKADQP
jgi:hypothetical protein